MRVGLSEAYERVHSQPKMVLELVYGADFIYFIFILSTFSSLSAQIKFKTRSHFGLSRLFWLPEGVHFALSLAPSREQLGLVRFLFSLCFTLLK